MEWSTGDRDRFVRRATVVRAAFLELLRKEVWTHEVTQTFRPELGVRGRADALRWYGELLGHASHPYFPRVAWMVAEPHPRHKPFWHMHGLWAVSPGQLWRGWWRGAKEHWGRSVGWARFRPLPDQGPALVSAVAYALKHATKAHPVACGRFMHWFRRLSDDLVAQGNQRYQ